MLKRDQQIEIMKDAKQRTVGYVRAWLSNKEFKAALHRYDDNHDNEPVLCSKHT